MDFKRLEELIYYSSLDLIDGFNLDVIQSKKGLRYEPLTYTVPYSDLGLNMYGQTNFCIVAEYKLIYKSKDTSLTRVKTFKYFKELVDEALRSINFDLKNQLPHFACLITENAHTPILRCSELTRETFSFSKVKSGTLCKFGLIFTTEFYEIKESNVHCIDKYGNEKVFTNRLK